MLRQRSRSCGRLVVRATRLARSSLAAASSPAALLLAADLHAERGEVARALCLAERVLLPDVDAPGARERHARWRAQLGGRPPERRGFDAATLIRPAVAEVPYTIAGEAGRGGAGVVCEAIDEALGRNVAFKSYHRPADDRAKLEREARVAVALAGLGVVRVFDVDPARGSLVMEWVERGSLERWIRRGELAVLWPIERWLGPPAAALARVHASGRAGFADDIFALGRILQEVLDALGPDVDPEGVRRWRSVAARATGAAAERPVAAELATLG
jgi:serine/threonine-protein kinase